MAFTGFSDADFAVLEIEGFEPRMNAVRERLTPKLLALAQELAPDLTQMAGTVFYPHVAKHMRRSVNPVDDTWCALGPNPRGYKMLPHFQIGLWKTHAFIQAGVIYESPAKKALAAKLPQHWNEVIGRLPEGFRVLSDYTKPHGKPAQSYAADNVAELAALLAKPNRGDLMVGREFDRTQVAGMTADNFKTLALETFGHLLPLYRLAAE